MGIKNVITKTREKLFGMVATDGFPEFMRGSEWIINKPLRHPNRNAQEIAEGTRIRILHDQKNFNRHLGIEILRTPEQMVRDIDGPESWKNSLKENEDATHVDIRSFSGTRVKAPPPFYMMRHVKTGKWQRNQHDDRYYAMWKTHPGVLDWYSRVACFDDWEIVNVQLNTAHQIADQKVVELPEFWKLRTLHLREYGINVGHRLSLCRWEQEALVMNSRIENAYRGKLEIVHVSPNQKRRVLYFPKKSELKFMTVAEAVKEKLKHGDNIMFIDLREIANVT